MDLASLKAELAGDAYKGLSAEAAAEAINAPTVPKIVPIAPAAIKAALIAGKKWGAIKAAAARSPGSPADVFVDMLDAFAGGFDQAAKASLLMPALDDLGGLVEAGDRAAISALDTTIVSRAAELGWDAVQPSDVAAARALDDAGNDTDYAARAASVEARDRAWEAAKASGADPARDYDDWLNAYEAARRAG